MAYSTYSIATNGDSFIRGVHIGTDDDPTTPVSQNPVNTFFVTSATGIYACATAFHVSYDNEATHMPRTISFVR